MLRRQRTLTAYLFLAPNLLAFLLFMVVPFVWVFWLTFQTGGILGPAQFVGFKNWAGLLKDPVVLQTIRNTFVYAVIAIPTVFAISLALALVLQRIRRLANLIRAALYFPTLMPVVLAALIWVFVIHPDFGFTNLLLKLFGLPVINWLGSPLLALVTIAGLEVWRGVGFWTLLFLAALVGIPAELYEAANIDGAGRWASFRYVTLPQLRPTFLFATVMATIWNLQIFDSVYILTDGAPQHGTASVVWYIYKSIFEFDKPGYGAALSFLLLAVTLVLSLVQIRLLRRTA